MNKSANINFLYRQAKDSYKNNFEIFFIWSWTVFWGFLEKLAKIVNFIKIREEPQLLEGMSSSKSICHKRYFCWL